MAGATVAKHPFAEWSPENVEQLEDELGSYLICGFRVNQADDMLNLIVGNSKIIDGYYDSYNAGIKINKPSIKIHEFWLKICDAAIEICGSRWPSVTNLLLDIKYPDQENTANLLSNSLQNKGQFKDRCIECMSPLYNDKCIVFYIYHGNFFQRLSPHAIAKNVGHFYLRNKLLTSVLIITLDCDVENPLVPKMITSFSK